MLSIIPNALLNAPPVFFGAARHPTPAAYYTEIYQAQNPLVSIVLSASAVPSTFAEIEKVVTLEPPEDKPADAVIRRAKKLLEEAHAHVPIYLMASEIESFDGDLLIHWTSLNKRMTIISPRQQDQPMRLYKRIASGWSELTPNPSPADLTAALEWAMQ